MKSLVLLMILFIQDISAFKLAVRSTQFRYLGIQLKYNSCSETVLDKSSGFTTDVIKMCIMMKNR